LSVDSILNLGVQGLDLVQQLTLELCAANA